MEHDDPGRDWQNLCKRQEGHQSDWVVARQRDGPQMAMECMRSRQSRVGLK